MATTACGSGDGDGGSPTVGGDGTSSATSGAGSSTGTGSATAGADGTLSNARPVEVVAERSELPSDLALIVSRGGELWRIHRAPNGTVEERLLFDPFAYSGNEIITFWNIHHLGAALPRGQLAIAVCTTGECGGVGAASEDAVMTVFKSRDGGVSWEAGDELDGVALIAAGDTFESLMLQRLPREEDSRTGRYELWPSGRVVDPPASHAGERGPVVLDNGVTGWWTADGRLIDGGGELLIDLAAELTGGSVAQGMSVLANDDSTRLAVTWIEMLPNGGTEAWRWSIYELVGNRYELSDTLNAPFDMIPTAWLDANRLLLNGDFPGDPSPRLPAILNVSAGTATGIEVPEGSLGQGWAVAAQVGPFAEVNAGEGDCLNLRAEAAADAAVLRCIPHATLLERLSPIDGEWVNARTPDGVAGWVSGEFVRHASDVATASATASSEPTTAAGDTSGG